MACSATYMQGEPVGYILAAHAAGEKLSSITQISNNDGTPLSAMTAMLSMVTMGQALLPESEHKHMADATLKMIEQMGKSGEGESVVAGVKYKLTKIDGVGVWLYAGPNQ